MEAGNYMLGLAPHHSLPQEMRQMHSRPKTRALQHASQQVMDSQQMRYNDPRTHFTELQRGYGLAGVIPPTD